MKLGKLFILCINENKSQKKVYNSLESVSIKRHILCKCRNRGIEIHGFCDSSAKAYCTVVYVRVVCSHGVKVSLWAGKCGVAPMKELVFHVWNF